VRIGIHDNDERLLVHLSECLGVTPSNLVKEIIRQLHTQYITTGDFPNVEHLYDRKETRNIR
jgi:hypothetical protein